MDIQTVMDRAGLPGTARPLVEELDRVWRSASDFAEFPCIPGCAACCSVSAITCSTLEFKIARSHVEGGPVAGPGCIFKTKTGCTVYHYRPMSCRMFGYSIPYDVPGIAVRAAGLKRQLIVAAVGKCPKRTTTTKISQEKLSEIMRSYQAIFVQTGFVMMGTEEEEDFNAEVKSVTDALARAQGRQFWFPTFEQ